MQRRESRCRVLEEVMRKSKHLLLIPIGLLAIVLALAVILQAGTPPVVVNPVDDLRALKMLLQDDPDAVAYLNSKGADSLALLQGIIDYSLIGADLMPARANAGGAAITQACTPGTVEGQAITLNTIGAYLNAKYKDGDLSTDRGNIRGDTRAAHLFILIHELANVTAGNVNDCQ